MTIGQSLAEASQRLLIAGRMKQASQPAWESSVWRQRSAIELAEGHAISSWFRFALAANGVRREKAKERDAEVIRKLLQTGQQD